MGIDQWIAIIGLMVTIALGMWHNGHKLGRIESNMRGMTDEFRNMNRNIVKLFIVTDEHDATIKEMKGKLEKLE